MFLPFYMCGAVLIFLTIRLLFKGEIQDAYRKIDKSKYILIFGAISCITSIIYQNWLGALCSVCLVCILSFVLYYRIHIDKELFEFITNLIVILSFFAALYGLVEYIGILNDFGIDKFEIIFFNSPKNRVNSVFFNANYYAMMIEFFVLIAFYKLLQFKNIKNNLQSICKLLIIIALNLFLLVLTACRTAWPALAAGLLVVLIVDKRYKTCTAIFVIIAAILFYFLLNPEQFPRVDNIIDYFHTRMTIWEVAIKNIKTHPLFGEGPMTYMHIYKLYNGHPTQHAHSIYLDPLLCFGIIGIASICPYVFNNIKKLFQLWRAKIDKTFVALVTSFTIMILVHGMLDYTIFFVQTGFLYLLIASSFDVYSKELNMIKK